MEHLNWLDTHFLIVFIAFHLFSLIFFSELLWISENTILYGKCRSELLILINLQLFLDINLRIFTLITKYQRVCSIEEPPQFVNKNFNTSSFIKFLFLDRFWFFENSWWKWRKNMDFLWHYRIFGTWSDIE